MKDLRCLLFASHKLKVVLADKEGAIYQCERCKKRFSYVFTLEHTHERLWRKCRGDNAT